MEHQFQVVVYLLEFLGKISTNFLAFLKVKTPQYQNKIHLQKELANVRLH